MFLQPEQVEGMGTFAGNGALWIADEGSSPGHQMFGSSDPMIYLRYTQMPPEPALTMYVCSLT